MTLRFIGLPAAVFLSLLFLSSCATQNAFQHSSIGKDTTVFKFNQNYQYAIRKDDKISISVWDHEEMGVGSVYGIYNSNEAYGKWLLVDDNGNVTAPKLGEVHVAGKTVVQAEEQLRDQYKKWIVNPIVDVKVLNKEVTLMGELRLPGRYLLERDHNTLMDMIGKAGDFDAYANRKQVMVIRMVDNEPKSIRVNLTHADDQFTQNLQIHPGDIVYVPSRKGKSWEKRAGSTIVPIAAIISSIALINSLAK